MSYHILLNKAFFIDGSCFFRSVNVWRQHAVVKITQVFHMRRSDRAMLTSLPISWPIAIIKSLSCFVHAVRDLVLFIGAQQRSDTARPSA